MAEAVFQDMVNKAGLSDKIEVDSAGTGHWHVGQPAHVGTLSVLKANGIPYKGRARQLERQDLDDFDYVLVMDRENLTTVRQYTRGTHAEVNLFLSYAQAAGLVDTDVVPDPYYDNSFDRTYRLVTVGSKALLDYIRKEHGI
jgi:protein-tyrosine phosphatase